jgi:two-component system, cell cycle sensor histidine kinase and response regulator CckA
MFSRHFYFLVMLFTVAYCVAFTLVLTRRHRLSETPRRFMFLLAGTVAWSVKDALGELLLPDFAGNLPALRLMLVAISPMYLVMPVLTFGLLMAVHNAAVKPERRFGHTDTVVWSLVVGIALLYGAALVRPTFMYRTIIVTESQYRYDSGPGLYVLAVVIAALCLGPVTGIISATWKRPRSEPFYVAMGILLTTIFAIATNVLPHALGLAHLPRLGCLSASVACTATFAGIVRYGSSLSLERVLEERAKYRLIAEGMEALLKRADENALYRQLCDHAREIADAVYVSVVLFLEGNRMCEVRAVSLRELNEEIILSAELPLLAGTVYEPGPNSLLMRQRATQGILEARSVEEFAGVNRGTPLPEPFRRIRQVLSYPIVHGEDIRGAMLLMRNQRTQDAELFRVFAVQCSLVLRFTWQIAELQRIRRLEEQLHRAQRLEAVGQLAGGIAHDFNNTLSGITGYAQLIRRKYGDQTPEIKGYADAIISASRRSAELTEKLLAFARKGVVQPVALDMHTVIRESMQILEPTFQDTMIIEKELRAAPSTVMGDPAALQNVLINLAINARNAMPKGGTLRVVTRNLTLDRPLVIDDEYEVAPGSYLLLSVADTGVGMDATTRRRVFEPFFTTDSTGKGSGLGLAMVYGTVKSHHGYVVVESVPGQGSTFTVYVPLVRQETPAMATPRRKTEQIVRGNGHVLVVDDDALICSLSKDMLAFMGYTVTAMNSGEAAVEFVRANPDSVDVALIDIMMPGMDGYETFHQLRKIRPDLKAVFTTGYSLPRDTRYMTALGFSGFIQKPFDSSKLSQTLYDILHGRIPGLDKNIPPAPSA